MYIIPETAGTSAVYDFCLKWLKVLSLREYDSACEMLGPDEGDEHWTPQGIQRSIETVGLHVDREGEGFCVTPPESATDDDGLCASMGEACRQEEFAIEVHPCYPIQVMWLLVPNLEKPWLVGSVRLFYPINGRWSDLSSSFSIRKVVGGLAFELRYIDIM